MDVICIGEGKALEACTWLGEAVRGAAHEPISTRCGKGAAAHPAGAPPAAIARSGDTAAGVSSEGEEGNEGAAVPERAEGCVTACSDGACGRDVGGIGRASGDSGAV